MADVESFRAETRAWLEANCPPSMRAPMPDDEAVGGGKKEKYKNPDSKIWLERMAAKGWTAPSWPREYGGGGLNDAEARVLDEEMHRLGCRPPIRGMGFSMLGPTLLEYGTEEQKRKHLPKIVTGEIRWCQGYSEPGSGSDLASLSTRAVLQGEHFLVNGHKIWTSGAHLSDWIFCLVRTDPTVKKHDGISFLLIDMDQPGVRPQPIRLISGYSVFCETFFENVQVPANNLVGELNKGWTIAKRLLEHERKGIGGIGERARERAERTPAALAKHYVGETGGRIANPVLRDAIARYDIDAQAFTLTRQRTAEEAKSGTPPGPASAMFKYYATELNKRRYELLLDSGGTELLGWEGPGFEPDNLRTTRDWLRAKANTIEGGTSEIQLNIIAKRVLRLPD
ncbi:MAG: acyl-CoA dehydrogenase family protein [Alphaproteobacteria bacterium]|nr:acyl-CoA dehydrogenase family protein [Alphaproteobacteria bacterium]